MPTQQQEYQPDDRSKYGPPVIAENLLSFFLPASLRDPILGDLEEEFAERICAGSTWQVYRWYWRQALQSTCLFIWKQRGSGMAYLFSVIFLCLILGLAIFTSSYAMWLISIPVILLTVPASFILGIGATSFRAAKLAFRLSFSDAATPPVPSVHEACRFLRVTGNQFLLVSGIAFLLGFIQVLLAFSGNPELLNGTMHYARYGMAFLPLFYGLIFKSLFYSAEQKLIGRYLQE